MSHDFILGCIIGAVGASIPFLAFIGCIRIVGRNYSTKKLIEILDRDIRETTAFRDALMTPGINVKDHLANIGNADTEMDSARLATRRYVFPKAKPDGMFAGVRKMADRMIEAYRRQIREMIR